jgi:cysteine desulfurase
MSGPIYLDYNAGAPVKPAVAAALSAALAETGNASSVHRFGRLARRRIEAAREGVAALVGASPSQVIFTSGGTEANNLALAGLARRRLVSAVEHDSVLNAAPEAERIAVDAEGRIDLAALEARLSAVESPALVAVMLANNETGVLQPVTEAARIAHAHGALLHCDAVQAPGKIALDLPALGVDSLALSAHKFGGPQGVGALVVRDGSEIEPLLRGGGQESGRRAGTENVAGIHGFGVAARLAEEDLARADAIAAMRDEMERRIRAAAPEAVVVGANAPRLPNTSAIAMPGRAAETQVIAFDLAGIAVSAGAACSSGKVRASHVLQAMGLPEAIAAGTIRVSLGWRTSAGEIDRFVETWLELWARRGDEAAARPAPAA